MLKVQKIKFLECFTQLNNNVSMNGEMGGVKLVLRDYFTLVKKSCVGSDKLFFLMEFCFKINLL